MDIRNKTLLLSGASGGIGEAFAIALAEAGGKLVLVGRNEERLAALLRRLPGKGHLIVPADLTRSEGVEQVAQACSGGIDVLINNAGINHFGLLASQSEAQLREMLEVNTLAPILLVQRLLPLLADRESIIVNVGSGFGSIGFAGYCGYSASKFALRGFSEALRRELADSAIQVCYFAPRATRTPMNSAAAVAMNTELGTAMDEPDHVAKALVLLLRKPRQYRYLGWPERFFVKLNSVFPAMVDKALKGQLPVIRRQALASTTQQR